MQCSSEQIGEVVTALVAFQAEMPNVHKAAVNPHFKSKYAALEAIMPQILPVLTKHGLGVSHHVAVENGCNVLITRLYHTGGQWIGSVMPLMAEKQTPQGLGSAITYMRRYSLCALLGIAADPDDDGDAAERGVTVAKSRARREESPKPTPLRDTIVGHVRHATDIEKMGEYTARINRQLAAKGLTAEDAKECLSEVAKRTAELATAEARKPKPPADPGELFGTAEEFEGVGL